MITSSFFKKWPYRFILPFLFLITSFSNKQISDIAKEIINDFPQRTIVNSYPLTSVDKHALYIGVIQITMEEIMTIQVKVFSDDLQAILQNEVGYQATGATDDLCMLQMEHLQQYFQRTLQVHINELPIDLVLNDCEQINDVHLLQFKAIDCPLTWQQVAIKANFFMELFPTQSNVLQLHYKDNEKNRRYGRMNRQAPSLLFRF